jgi:Ni/Co efflux regulator RcnB
MNAKKAKLAVPGLAAVLLMSLAVPPSYSFAQERERRPHGGQGTPWRNPPSDRSETTQPAQPAQPSPPRSSGNSGSRSSGGNRPSRNADSGTRPSRGDSDGGNRGGWQGNRGGGGRNSDGGGDRGGWRGNRGNDNTPPVVVPTPGANTGANSGGGRDRNNDGRPDGGWRGNRGDNDGRGDNGGRGGDYRGRDRDRDNDGRPDGRPNGGGRGNRGDNDGRGNYDRDRDRRHNDGWNRDRDRGGWSGSHHGGRRFDYRNDNRWRSYTGVRLGFYFFPGRGYYRVPDSYYNYRWARGEVLPSYFYSYRIYDWDYYGLPSPPYGCGWFFVGQDAVLIDLRSGEILDIIYDVW